LAGQFEFKDRAAPPKREVIDFANWIAGMRAALCWLGLSFCGAAAAGPRPIEWFCSIDNSVPAVICVRDDVQLDEAATTDAIDADRSLHRALFAAGKISQRHPHRPRTTRPLRPSFLDDSAPLAGGGRRGIRCDAGAVGDVRPRGGLPDPPTRQAHPSRFVSLERPTSERPVAPALPVAPACSSAAARA